MTFINILNDTVYIHFAFKKLLMPTIFKKSAYEWLIFVSLNNHKKIMTIIVKKFDEKHVFHLKMKYM
jgi:hypothetical protein